MAIPTPRSSTFSGVENRRQGLQSPSVTGEKRRYFQLMKSRRPDFAIRRRTGRRQKPGCGSSFVSFDKGVGSGPFRVRVSPPVRRLGLGLSCFDRPDFLILVYFRFFLLGSDFFFCCDEPSGGRRSATMVFVPVRFQDQKCDEQGRVWLAWLRPQGAGQFEAS